MPFDFQVDEARKLCTVRGRGPFDFKESSDILTTIARDSRFLPGYHVHLDLREMEFVPVADESWKLALILRSLRKSLTGKIAVSVSTPLHYGLARVIAMYAAVGGIRMRPFLRQDDALEWLGETRDEPEGATG